MSNDEAERLKKAESNRRVNQAAIEFAKLHRAERGHYPLIMDMPIYKFFGGDWVKIVEVNMFDDASNAEVTIEDGWGERKRTEMSELSLKDR